MLVTDRIPEYIYKCLSQKGIDVDNIMLASYCDMNDDHVFCDTYIFATKQKLLIVSGSAELDGAAERGGSAAARDIEELVSACCGLFAGGELDEEEKDGIMAALNEAYWIAKRSNAKYGARGAKENKG